MPFTSPGTYPSLGQTGYLTTFAIGVIASPQLYATVILDVRSIKTNDFTIPEVNTTTLQSPNSTEEFLPGLIKPGNIELTGNFVGDTTQLAIPAFATGGASGPQLFGFKITAPVQQGAKTYVASGVCYVSKWEVGPFENNKAIDVSAGFQITGTITYSVS